VHQNIFGHAIFNVLHFSVSDFKSVITLNSRGGGTPPLYRSRGRAMFSLPPRIRPYIKVKLKRSIDRLCIKRKREGTIV